MIKIVVMGAAGRMGRQIIANIVQDKGLNLAGAIENSKNGKWF